MALLVRLRLGDGTLLEVWLEAAAQAAPYAHPLDPLNFSEVISSAGIFFGLACGAILVEHLGGFSVLGSWQQRAARLPIGLAGAALLAPAPGESYLEIGLFFIPIIQYLHYTLIGLWIAGLAPLLFIRLGLAQKKD